MTTCFVGKLVLSGENNGFVLACKFKISGFILPKKLEITQLDKLQPEFNLTFHTTIILLHYHILNNNVKKKSVYTYNCELWKKMSVFKTSPLEYYGRTGINVFTLTLLLLPFLSRTISKLSKTGNIFHTYNYKKKWNNRSTVQRNENTSENSFCKILSRILMFVSKISAILTGSTQLFFQYVQ